MPTLRLSTLRRHRAALATAVVGCVGYLVWQPPTNDLANQNFRSWLFGQNPFTPVNNHWFGGHHTFNYSAFAPALGWLLGPMVVGVLALLTAALGSSVLCHAIVERTPGLRWPQRAAVVATLGCMMSLYGGRTAFLLGTAFALAALAAAVHDRPVLTALLAAGVGCSSPVAALFLTVLAGAMWLGRSARLRVTLALAVPSFGIVGVLSALFPDFGSFSFPFGGLFNTLFGTALAMIAGRRHATVRWAGLAYAAMCLLVSIVPTPIGGNAVRLAAIAVPVVLVLCPLGKAWWTPLLMAETVVFLWLAPISLAITGSSEQTEAGFYKPLIDVLEAREGLTRVEVVPVASHDEANFVARHALLARGWHRQLDLFYNDLLYEEMLDPDAYLAWLEDNGVSVVAIADTKIDYGGRAEQALLADPPDYLHEIYRDDTWRVFEVEPAPALASPGVEVTDIGLSSFTIEAEAAGEVSVKVRFSPWMAVDAGDACVREGADGWVVVEARSAGRITVEASLSLSRAFDRDGDC